MKNIIILAIAVCLSTTVVNGSVVRCAGVPSMSVAAVCAKMNVSGFERVAELCPKTLKTAPAGNTETSVYASIALEAAEASINATYVLINDQLSHNASLTEKTKAAYQECSYIYGSSLEARIRLLKELLSKCSLGDLIVDTASDDFDLEKCSTQLLGQPGGDSSPVYEAMVGDRYRLDLASYLIQLASNRT